MKRALVLVALAACSDPPPLTIKYALKTEGSQLCYSNLAAQTVAASCTEVSMLCRSVLDLRVVSAADTTKQYVRLCQEVIGRPNLCSIAGVDLPAPVASIPEQTLEVEVALYRWDDLAHDDQGNPICPSDLAFGADGLPVSSAPSPAVGGRAFYHPGDTTTVVDLGCTDEAAIQDPKCANMNTVAVTATVKDFDSEVSVTPMLADNLSVSIGEPDVITVGTMTEYELPSIHLHALDRTVTGPIPGWGSAVDIELVASACLDVFEGVGQATPSTVCKPVLAGQSQVDLPGVRVATTTVNQILTAYSLPSFPAQGLVIGMVLDNVGNPAPNVTVVASDGTAVSYLDTTRTHLVVGGTTTNGIFMSTAAAYGTTFTAQGNGINDPTGFGGLIQGKVNVVVLQFTNPTKP